jgi:Mlc titration factor MtfA (ptsG expression regulator)
MPAPAHWIGLIRENVLLSRVLGDEDFARLCEVSHALAGRLYWEGCRGQVITDEVKASIAGQGSFLLLGLDGYLFDHLHTILVYPGSFVAVDEESGEREVRLGEAMPDGPVALSWWHSRWDGRRLGASNVVMHELAHKLAELGDPEIGMPPFGQPGDASRWKKVMSSVRRQLERDHRRGVDTLLDPYGAESMSELFAVATETFFLEPRALREELPSVFQLLAHCYRQDPCRWEVPEEVEEASEAAEAEYARQAVSECTAAIRKWPEDLSLYRERAEWREAVGDHEGALSDWREVAERAEDTEDRMEALNAQAQALYSLGREDEAYELTQEALKLEEELGDREEGENSR